MYSDGYESQDAKENALIDFALAGLEQTIKAKPVYKTIKVDEPHIVKRTGLDVETYCDDFLLNSNSTVQTFGIPDWQGNIFVYSVADGKLVSGWTEENILNKF